MFIVFALPRSRTAWLSHFLTYGDWTCGHDELRHARSLDDVSTWFKQPYCGTVETNAAPFWRIAGRFAPGANILVVRRPVEEVVESLMAIPRVAFDRDALTAAIHRLDRKLDQMEARLSCLSVRFDDLRDEETCARVFQHCLPYRHDHQHWASLDPVNIQVNFYALTRYCEAYRAALDRLALIAKQQSLAAMSVRPVESTGIRFQTESFDAWLRDAEQLFDAHLVQVGEAPGDWRTKNIPLMRTLHDAGAMQITTARCNGKMFGYLMTLISPSLTSESGVTGTNTTFYASPEFPGLGLKIQRAALGFLKERGVSEVFWEAGQRGSGPRLGTMYRRLGATDHGHTYRLQLAEVA